MAMPCYPLQRRGMHLGTWPSKEGCVWSSTAHPSTHGYSGQAVSRHMEVHTYRSDEQVHATAVNGY